jgi:hypothetical protein
VFVFGNSVYGDWFRLSNPGLLGPVTFVLKAPVSQGPAFYGVGLTAQKSLKHAAAPQALKCIPDENSNGKPALPFEARLECDLSCVTWHRLRSCAALPLP